MSGAGMAARASLFLTSAKRTNLIAVGNAHGSSAMIHRPLKGSDNQSHKYRSSSSTPYSEAMPTRWTHITINCSDIDASVEFYTSICGLTIVRDRRLEGRHNVWLGPATPAGEDPVFVLVIVQDEVKARLDHFGFQCDSRKEVDRIAELARQQNILVEPPVDVGGVVGYFTMVRDPDGHIVEFTFGQPLKGL
jgi:lactoylglutathione lyase